MRKRILFSLLTVLASLTFAFAQEEDPPNLNWARYYESADMAGRYHWIYDLFAIPGGGYALGGKVSMWVNHSAAWLLVTDEGGQVSVDRLFDFDQDNSSYVSCNSLIKTDDGGYLMGGRTQWDDGDNFDVIKTDEDGELSWWSVFGNTVGQGCCAVIELKGGNYIAAGQSMNSQAYAVMVDENGDAVWDNTYHAVWFFSVREVAGDGLLFSGYSRAGPSLLIKTDYNGEVIWTSEFAGGALLSLVSCPQGGFAACGRAPNGQGFYLCRIDNDGNPVWSGNYLINDWLDVPTGLAVLPDGGFVLSGHFENDNHVSLSATVRTDAQGNERWRRVADTLPFVPNDVLVRDFSSAIVKQDGSIVYGGSTLRVDDMDNSRMAAVVVCLDADRSAPHIVEYLPDTLSLTVLTGDSVFFIVRAEDLQEDSLLYSWTLDNEELSTDTFAIVTFEESGLSTVKCVVSDGALADSVMWLVNVRDFYISSYFPQNLNLVVHRNTEQDFWLMVEAIDDLELFYTWTFIGRDRRRQIIGHTDSVAVVFPFSGSDRLSVAIQGDQEVETVDWDIQVSSPVWYWWPHELELTVPVDTVMDFVIFPFNPDSDSLEYQWKLDGELIEDEESEVEFTLVAIGEHVVTACVSEGMAADTVRWLVDVRVPDSTPENRHSLLPVETVLYPPVPNPFNSEVSFRFYLPHPGLVELNIHDMNGRIVEELVDNQTLSGFNSFSWNADRQAAGVYFLVLKTNGVQLTEKLLVIK